MKTWMLRAGALLSVIAAAALLAACGSSESNGTKSTAAGGGGTTTGTSTQPSDSAAAKSTRAGFVSCLKSHGVTVSFAADGAIQPSDSTSPAALEVALRECAKKYGAQFTAATGAKPTATQREAGTKFTECLKKHGISVASLASKGKSAIAEAEKLCGAYLHAALAPTTGADIKVGKIKIGKIDLSKIKIGKIHIGKIHIGEIHIKSLEKLGTQSSLKSPTTPAPGN